MTLGLVLEARGGVSAPTSETRSSDRILGGCLGEYPHVFPVPAPHGANSELLLVSA